MCMCCACWIVGAHMVHGYIIRMEPDWMSLRIFNCAAGNLSSVSAIPLLRAHLALVKYNWLTIAEQFYFIHSCFFSLSCPFQVASRCISDVTRAANLML